jgi:predicted DNA-binding protein (MmcQ/YjbR family)
MTYEEYNAFCGGLPATTHVVQWGGSHVWKVGGKVFAIGGWHDGKGEPSITFKVSEIAYEMLKRQPGLRPAPYLASRGMEWIRHYGVRTPFQRKPDFGVTSVNYPLADMIAQGSPPS